MEYVYDLGMLSKHADNLVQFVESFESLYQRCIGQRDISLEDFKQYQTELTKLAYRHSFDISGTLDESSLESIYTLSFEADDQKKNIVVRAWEAFLAILERIWNAISSLWKKKEQKTSEEVKQITAEVKEITETKPVKTEKKLSLTVPKALVNGWGYKKIDDSTKNALDSYLKVFQLLDKLYDNKNPDLAADIVTQIEQWTMYIKKIVESASLEGILKDTELVEGNVAKFQELAKHASVAEGKWTTSKANHTRVENQMEVTVNRLKKIKVPPTGIAAKEKNRISKLVNAATDNMNRIRAREMACYTSIKTSVSQIRKLIKDQPVPLPDTRSREEFDKFMTE